MSELQGAVVECDKVQKRSLTAVRRDYESRQQLHLRTGIVLPASTPVDSLLESRESRPCLTHDGTDERTQQQIQQQ